MPGPRGAGILPAAGCASRQRIAVVSGCQAGRVLPIFPRMMKDFRFFPMTRILRMAVMLFAGLIPVSSVHAALPTASRAWKSTAGTVIEAKATSLDGGVVTLEAANGRVLKVDLFQAIGGRRCFSKPTFRRPGQRSRACGREGRRTCTSAGHGGRAARSGGFPLLYCRA